MAKTLEQLTQETLGAMHWKMLQLLAQAEKDRDRILELERAQITTPEKSPVKPSRG